MNKFCKHQLRENPGICDEKVIGCHYTPNDIY